MDSINLLGVSAPDDNVKQPKPKRGCNSAIPLPSQQYLRECFDYDEQSGVLTWKERPRHHFNRDQDHKWWNGRYAGKTAGGVSGGYANVEIERTNYKVHRIAYKWATGLEPVMLDHIDGVRDNNALSNLRPATNTINQRNVVMRKNNTSGITGVSRQNGRWIANITVDRKQKYLGYYDKLDDAIAARRDAEAKYGFDPYHGLSAEERANRTDVEEVV